MHKLVRLIYSEKEHVGLEQVITWAAMYIVSGMILIMYVVQQDDWVLFPFIMHLFAGLMMWVSGIASSRQRTEEKKHPPIVMTESPPLVIPQYQYPFNPNSFYPTDGYGSEEPTDTKDTHEH